MAQPRTSVSLTTTRVGGGNKPQRHNNPGNIKYSKAVDHLVQRGADGLPLADEEGHLIFKTLEDGWEAFEIDISAKQKGGDASWVPEGASLETLGRGVGEMEHGYAEDPLWAEKVAQILGVPITTPINQIPVGDLTQAIARQEGFYADGGGEFETTSGTSLFPQTEGRITAVRPSDMPGISTSDEDVSTVEEALAKQRIIDQYGEISLPLDYGETKIEVKPWTDVTTRGHRFPRGPESLTPSEAIRRVKAGEPLDSLGQEPPFDLPKAGKLLSRVGQGPSREIDATDKLLEQMGGTTDLTTAEAQRRAQAIEEGQVTEPTTSALPEDEMISRYEDAEGPAVNPYSLDRAAKTAAPEQPSFLSRLGSGIKDNPEVAMQIAALLGGVGSGLMGRGRLAKQQAEQDAANRLAAAYSYAISTLTRGRTTPAIAPRQVRSAPGKAETIMDVLGTLGQGGAEIAAAHRQRGQAEEDRQFTKDTKTRELDIKEYEIEQRSADVAAAAAAKNITDKATGGITPKQAQVIRAGLDNLQAIFDSGGPFETGTLSFGRTYGESAAIQNDFESSRNTLIAEIKDLMGLDRLTDRDLLLVIDTLPQRNDSAGAIRGTLRGIKNTLSRLESIYSGGAGGGGGAGQASANTNLGAMSPGQFYQHAQLNRNDPAVEAELRRRVGEGE
jgi:hypothetical protein